MSPARLLYFLERKEKGLQANRKGAKTIETILSANDKIKTS